MTSGDLCEMQNSTESSGRSIRSAKGGGSSIEIS